MPRRGRVGQFLPPARALGEQADRPPCRRLARGRRGRPGGEGGGVGEQAGERGERAGGDRIAGDGGEVLDAGAADVARRIGRARGLEEKGGLGGVGLDQHRLHPGDDGEHQPRQAGAGAEIDDAPRAGRQVRGELARVEDVAAPDVARRPPPDQVAPPLPVAQEIDIGLEPRQRPGRDVERLRAGGGGQRRPLPRGRSYGAASAGMASGRGASGGAGRRTWRSSAVTAAGVTPGMRAACPTVAGRARSSFSSASPDSPPTAP